jgi:hypothetical protein
MAAKEEPTEPVDPFEAFRGMRDNYLDAMSKVMINAVNSEEYAQATGAMLNGTLAASAPIREAYDKAMAAALEKSSMPSRQEVAALAGRLTNIEMRLDDMEAKLDRIVELCSAPQPPSVKPETNTQRTVTPEQKFSPQRSRKKG